MRGAYLVGHLDLKHDPPVVSCVSMYSSDARNLTTTYNTYSFDIFRIEGNLSYHELRIKLIDYMASKLFPYKWVFTLLDKSLMSEVQKAMDALEMNEALE